MTKLGRSKRSLRIEKQNVHGMGSPDGLSKTQCENTDWVVFSKACDANFSQYSITDWFSKSYEVCSHVNKSSLNQLQGVEKTNLVDILSAVDEILFLPFSQQTKFRANQTYFSRTSPYDGRRTTERNEFLEFLIFKIRLLAKIIPGTFHLRLALTTCERSKHFSIKMKSSSDIGVCRAIIDGR